jgi:predicted TIM-barrel fold metal-dependent hydrolase
MHTGYPYVEETIAVAKHFPNVWVDLCWAWTVNPRTTMEFMRRFIHGVPISKIFAFGGDTNTPTTSFAYSLQMRKWLTRSLQAEVSDGEMTERDAIDVATRILRENQLSFFDLAGKRNSIRKQLRSREVKSAGGVG